MLTIVGQRTIQTHSDHLALLTVLEDWAGSWPVINSNLGSRATSDDQVQTDLAMLLGLAPVLLCNETHKRPMEDIIPPGAAVHRGGRNAIVWDTTVYPDATPGEFLISPRVWVGLRGKGMKGWQPPQHAAALAINDADRPVSFAAVHLPASQRFRARRKVAAEQAHRIVEWAKAQPGDVAVGGDWNTTPDAPQLAELRHAGMRCRQLHNPRPTMHGEPIDALWVLGSGHPAVCPTCHQPWPAAA